MEQARFLQEILQNHSTINIYLKSGIKLTGYLVGFDQYILWLKTLSGDEKIQAVYKHAIATISCADK